MEDINKAVRTAQFRRTVYDYYYPFIMYDEVAVQISSFMPDIRPCYYITNYGKCYNTETKYLLTPTTNNTGFIYYSLKTLDGKFKSIGAHILVCTAFNGPAPDDRYIARHIDGNKMANYPYNLEWSLTKINKNYWTDEAYNRSVYPPEKIHMICKLLSEGVTDPDVIAMKVFNEPAVHKYRQLIYDIRSGASWTNISSQYELGISGRNLTPEKDIHKICLYLQTHPNGPYDTRSILTSIGIDYVAIGSKQRHRYASVINQIRYRKAFTDISNKYCF